ncbi:MAG: PfkB family carbohydrate kinase [Burkholderiales bacterium]
MVVVFGSINLDLVARVPRIPVPGETIAGRTLATLPGGKGANQALAARRAGAAVTMIGAVGRDGFAAAALANLAAAGVDLTHVAAVDVPTGVALINVDDRGENAITVVPGANAHVRADDVADALLAPGGTLLMQLEVPVAEVVALAHRAHARGMTVVLNAAPAAALPAALLDDLDVLVVNEHEAAACARAWRLPESPAGFVADATERFGVAVVLTLGARGALTQVGGEVVRAAPAPVDVVDTTGAGDAFAGALAAALDRGNGLAAALGEGVRAGAAACEHAGAQHPVQQATR